MKMKSNVFGHSAKLALAVLAVCGTLFTSCYEKEDVDNQPLGDPEYYITGTVTDAKTGGLMTNVTVTVNGQNVTVTNGAFRSANLAYTANAIPVEVSAPNYNTFNKQVYLGKVGPGAIYIADASVALVSIGSIDVPGEEKPLASGAVAAANTVLTDAILAPGNATGDGGAITFGTPVKTPGTSDITVTYPATFANQITEGRVQYVAYEGFELAGNVTRATDTELFIAGAASHIGKQHGITRAVREINLPAWANFSISGYKIVHTFVPRTYAFTFNGAEHTGTIVSQEATTIYPVYFNHDTHNSHDGHGLNPNAGGGAGGY